MMKTRKLVPYIFYQCPHCGNLSTSYSYTTAEKGETRGQCLHCRKYYKEGELKEVEKKVWAFKCETCGDYVPNTPDHWNVLGASMKELLCPKCMHGKDGLVAINGHHISQLRIVPLGMIERGVPIAKNLYVLYMKGKSERSAVRYLNYLAKNEEQGFKVIPRRTVDCYILFSKETFFGYLAWSKNELPTIRQLFVVKSQRRTGYATALVRHFMENQCPKPNSEGFYFDIESPNEASSYLFIKLGLIEVKDDKIIGKKVRFVRSF